jgi:hypothetical protein
LATTIKHELNVIGHYEQTVVALLQPPAEYDAHELHHALSPAVSVPVVQEQVFFFQSSEFFNVHFQLQRMLLDEDTLIEILCSRNNQELNEIRTTYYRRKCRH